MELVPVYLAFILVLAIFLGFELISKVPATLHTPLMSGANAISGITIVGALLAAGAGGPGWLATLLGSLAVFFATVNVVGGYLVTDRMLGMFRKSPQPGSARGLPLASKSPQPGSARGLPLASKSPQPGSARGALLLGRPSRAGRQAVTNVAVNLAYIVAAVLFVFGLKMLGSPATARRGNALSAAGMLIAIVVTLLSRGIVELHWIAIAAVAGAVVGALAARLVAMTAMPEMVALFNGSGGIASLLVGWAALFGASDGASTSAVYGHDRVPVRHDRRRHVLGEPRRVGQAGRSDAERRVDFRWSALHQWRAARGATRLRRPVHRRSGAGFAVLHRGTRTRVPTRHHGRGADRRCRHAGGDLAA